MHEPVDGLVENGGLRPVAACRVQDKQTLRILQNDQWRAFAGAEAASHPAQGSVLSTTSSEANHAARSAMSASVRGFATTPITSFVRFPLR